MVCGLQYDFSPFTPSSDPIPLILCPPKAASGWSSKCALIQTFPASNFRAIRSAWSSSRVQTEAPSPMSLSLARRITSSSGPLQDWEDRTYTCD